jgi:hypothetical protein
MRLTPSIRVHADPPSFYIQNIRNNTNRARTPKWAIKAGLVDNSERDRKARKNQWAKRFDERNAQSTLVGQSLEEGEEGEDYNPVTEDPEAVERRRNEGLWNNDDEEYYDEGGCECAGSRNQESRIGIVVSCQG